MALRRFVERGADDFGILDRALHIRHFFGTFIDEQHDEIDFRMVRVDGIRDALEQNGFTGPGRRDDDPALAAPDGRHKIDDPAGQIFLAVFHNQLAIGINRREVIKKNDVAGVFRGFKTDFLHLEQGEITLPFLGRPYLPGNHITLAQIKAPNLRGGNINIVRAGHIARQWGTQKTVAVRQDFQHPVAVNGTAPGRTSLQHRKDEFLLPHGTGVFDLVLFRKLHEHGHAHVLQFSKAHRCAFLNLLRGNFLLPHTFRYLFWE